MKVSKVLFMVALIAVIVIFHTLSTIFPLCSDDFSYSYVCGGEERVGGVVEIIRSQCHHYCVWSGRFFVHCIAQFFLMLDKTAFNIANTLCYLLLSFYVALLCKNKNILPSWLAVAASFWVIMPHSGSTMFWLTGSCNYLWAACLLAIFLFLYLSEKRNLNILALVLAVPAGNSHEGMSLGLLLALLVYAAIVRRNGVLKVLGVIFYALGCFSNVVAPGNMVRLTSGGRAIGGVSDILVRYAAECWKIISNVLTGQDVGLLVCFVMFVIAVLFLLFSYKKGKCHPSFYLPLSLLIGAMSTLFINVHTGAVYPRAMFGFCYLSYLAFFILFVPLCHKMRSCVKYIVISIAGLFLIFEYVYAYKVISLFNVRLSHVEKEAKAGASLIADLPEWEMFRGCRYAEEYGISSYEFGNEAAVRYFSSNSFSVLPNHLVSLIFGNKNRILRLQAGEKLELADGIILHSMFHKPSKVWYMQTVDSSSKLPSFTPCFVKKFVKKVKPPKEISLRPMLFQLDGRYFSLIETAKGDNQKIYVEYN